MKTGSTKGSASGKKTSVSPPNAPSAQPNTRSPAGFPGAELRRAQRITNPEKPAQGKRVVWLMIRQHAWESGSSFLGEGAVHWMLSGDPEAVAYRNRVIFKVFPMMDPDGCAEGGVRFNRNGYDLNRNWDAVNITSSDDHRRMPEIFAAKKAMFQWISAGGKVDLFLTVHNQERGEWLSGSIVNPGRAQAFFDLLLAHISALRPLKLLRNNV